MKHVPRVWLRYFQLALLVLDAVVIGIYIYQLFSGSTITPHLHEEAEGIHIHGEAAGISLLFPAILAALHAIYTLTVVWWLDKRQTWWAHAPAIVLAGLTLVLLTNVETPIHSWVHILLIIFMFFATMAGVLPAGVVFAFAFTLLIVGSLGPGHLTADPAGHVVEMIMVSLSALSASGGWFVFNKRYVQQIDSQAVESLTSLVKQEQTTVSLILESISDGVMLISTKGNIQVLNTSLARILGWQKNEAQNLPYTALIEPALKAGTPDEAPVANAQQPAEELAIAKTLQSGKASQDVSLVKARDGRQVYLDIAASPMYQENKLVGIIAVIRDVDKQKREEQARSEFISTASHEMRTPVAAIEGYLALAMNDRVSTIDAKARSYLEKAHESTQHLGKLFQDLLTSTKAEDGRLSNHPVVVDMGQYLEQLVESLRFAAEKKGLLMEFVIGTGTPEEQSTLQGSKVVKPLYYIYADPDRIREVITNLFDNAVKYTPEGKISIGLTGNQDVVQLYVRDTGPGIPANDIPHLFQKFYRVDSSATRTIGGTGLGLFICRKIIELYHGRIWAESEVGKGSTFYINLPRLTAQKAAELQGAEAAKAANTSALDQS